MNLETRSRDAIYEFEGACRNNKLSDEDINQLFLDLKTENDEINQVLAVLEQERKALYDTYVA